MSLLSIPTDIITEILLKLPAKSLLSIKSVCKLWYEIINSPNFINLHVEQSNLHILFGSTTLHMSDDDTFDSAIELLDHPLKSFNEPYIHKGFNIKGLCRGLICFHKNSYPYTTILYNPTTRTHKFLPYFYDSRLKPTKYELGFGYDRVSDDYKCVWIFHHSNGERGSYKSQVMVYSLRANSWRQGAHDVPYNVCYHDNYCIDYKGVLHFKDDLVMHLCIVGFNLSDETFISVSLPNCEIKSYSCAHIGVLDDCLCFMLNHEYYSDVWIMKEYCVLESWTRLFRFANQDFLNIQPISLVNSRKQLLVSRERFYTYDVACVDLETLKTTHVELPSSGKILRAYVCSENLVMFKDAKGVPRDSERIRKKKK